MDYGIHSGLRSLESGVMTSSFPHKLRQAYYVQRSNPGWCILLVGRKGDEELILGQQSSLRADSIEHTMHGGIMYVPIRSLISFHSFLLSSSPPSPVESIKLGCALFQIGTSLQLRAPNFRTVVQLRTFVYYYVCIPNRRRTLPLHRPRIASSTNLGIVTLTSIIEVLSSYLGTPSE